MEIILPNFFLLDEQLDGIIGEIERESIMLDFYLKWCYENMKFFTNKNVKFFYVKNSKGVECLWFRDCAEDIYNSYVISHNREKDINNILND